MRVLHLALIAALAVAGPALAQNNAQHMLDQAKAMRANAEKLRPNLPPEAYAAMLKSAADIEKAVASGAYGKVGGPAVNVTNSTDLDKNVAERLMREHGRLDWLMTKAACAGYTQQNYSTFRYNPAINDRDSHCRNAHGHYATYLRVSRAGDAEAANTALFYYDAAARRAFGLVGN